MYESFGNISNGGLVAGFRHREIVSDFNRLWFMNADDEYVYYSDGLNNHYLSRYCDNDPEGSVILKKPCTNVTLNGDWLYYINESDHRVYRCLRSGRSESLFIREAVTQFVMVGKNDIVYATEAGDIKGMQGVLAEGIHPASLCVADGNAYFADGSNNYFLTFMNLHPAASYRKEYVADILPTYLNCDGQFIYFTDALRGNAIYKMHTQGGNPIKICGESAANLHIMDEKLYFWNGSTWKTIPLEGGRAIEVR